MEPEEMTREELLQRYKAIKHYLFMQCIHLPLSVEPYTQKEYELRQRLPEIYWEPRDHEAILWEQMGKADWINKS